MPRVPRGSFLHLAFSPDGRVLYAPYAWVYDTRGPLTMLRFAARDGRRLGRAEPIAPGVRTGDVLAFGGRWRAGSSLARTARWWCATRELCACCAPLPGRTVFPEREAADIDLGMPDAVALTPGGATLAAGGEDGAVRITDVRSGASATASGRHDGAVTGVLFAGGSELLVTIGDDARALVWDLQRRAVLETLAGHAGRVLTATADSRGRTLHTAGLDSRVITWDLGGARRLGRPFAAGRGVGTRGNFFPATAISADGRMLVTNQRGGVSLIDTASFSATLAARSRAARPEVNAPAFAAGGIVVAGLDGFLAILDTHTGRLRARLRGHRDVVFTPVTAAGGRRIVTTGLDATLRVWDGRSGRALGRPIRLDGPPNGHVAVASDSRIVAVPLVRGTVDVFNIRARQRLARLPIDGSYAVAAAFSDDGGMLVAGSADGRLRLFATAGWRPAGRGVPGPRGLHLDGGHQPGRKPLRHALRPTVRSASGTARPGGRSARRCPGRATSPPSRTSRRTARTCMPSTRTAAATAGTCARRPGRGGPARSLGGG